MNEAWATSWDVTHRGQHRAGTVPHILMAFHADRALTYTVSRLITQQSYVQDGACVTMFHLQRSI